MKKTLFVLLIGFLVLSVSCLIVDTQKQRQVKGKIFATSGAIKFNDFDGNFIAWKENKKAVGFWEISFPDHHIWFVCPPQQFPETPFQVQLTYRYIQEAKDIPVVRVIAWQKK